MAECAGAGQAEHLTLELLPVRGVFGVDFVEREVDHFVKESQTPDRIPPPIASIENDFIPQLIPHFWNIGPAEFNLGRVRETVTEITSIVIPIHALNVQGRDSLCPPR